MLNSNPNSWKDHWEISLRWRLESTTSLVSLTDSVSEQLQNIIYAWYPLSELWIHENSIDIEANNNIDYNTLWNLLSELWRYDEAIKLEPTNSNVYVNLWNHLIKMWEHYEKFKLTKEALKTYKKATDAYKKATELDLNNRKAWYNLWISYTRQWKSNEALISFEKAII